jgi:4-alpha-glucanotransferase
MRVLQFAFIDDYDNLHLPHNIPKNSLAYTGTHDNDTLLGWLYSASPEHRAQALRYCGFTGDNWGEGGFYAPAVRAMIRTLWASPAMLAIAPIQDLCGFGTDCKMNQPGVPSGNWAFRITQDSLDHLDRDWLRALNRTFYR